MRMNPQHVKRKFGWELVLISVLLFLLAGAWSQRRQELAAAQATLSVDSLAVAVPLAVPLVLK